jgi:hypothetical protein
MNGVQGQAGHLELGPRCGLFAYFESRFRSASENVARASENGHSSHTLPEPRA